MDIVHSVIAYSVASIASYYATAFLQAYLHRRLGHRPAGGFLFRTHIGSHHATYTPDRLMSDRYDPEEKSISGAYILPATLLALFAYMALPLGMFVVSGVAIVLSFAAHAHVHTQYHLNGAWLARFRWFRHKRELHFVHHREAGANFAVLEFGMDRLMRTYRAVGPQASKAQTDPLNEHASERGDARRKVARPTIGVAIIWAAWAVAGCSVYMEANRPTPVDLTQFHNGDARDAVVEKIGPPQGSVTEADGAACEFYQLYTHGYGAAGKMPIAVLEGAADVFTLGIAEVLLTPAESVTKNAQHQIGFCYRGQKLARMTEDGNCISGDCQRASQPAVARAQDASVPAPNSTAATPAVLASPAPMGPVPMSDDWRAAPEH